MKIDIQGRSVSMSEALFEHAERRLRFALTRSGDRIRRVVVRLGDVNGPRGGNDKFCRMQVHLGQGAPVLIEELGADLYAAIDRAAERAGRNAARRIERLREVPRWQPVVRTDKSDNPTSN